jgi:hypothetical protein
MYFPPCSIEISSASGRSTRENYTRAFGCSTHSCRDRFRQPEHCRQRPTTPAKHGVVGLTQEKTEIGFCAEPPEKGSVPQNPDREKEAQKMTRFILG